MFVTWAEAVVSAWVAGTLVHLCSQANLPAASPQSPPMPILSVKIVYPSARQPGYGAKKPG